MYLPDIFLVNRNLGMPEGIYFHEFLVFLIKHHFIIRNWHFLSSHRDQEGVIKAFVTHSSVRKKNRPDFVLSIYNQASIDYSMGLSCFKSWKYDSTGHKGKIHIYCLFSITLPSPSHTIGACVSSNRKGS